jgi:hypothetical protein
VAYRAGPRAGLALPIGRQRGRGCRVVPQRRRRGSSSEGRGVGAVVAVSGKQKRRQSDGIWAAVAAPGWWRRRGGVGVAATTVGQRRQHRGSSSHGSGGEGRWQAARCGGTQARLWGDVMRVSQSQASSVGRSQKQRLSNGDAIECPRVTTPLSASG